MARQSKTPATTGPGSGGKKVTRLKQMRQAYQMTSKVDRKLGPIMLGVFIIALAIMIGLGFLIGHPIYLGIFGLPMALLATTVVFSRRAESAAYAQVEGQPGAAAAVLNTLRGKTWTITPAVAVNRNQDVVHRVVGKPGIVLVGEGNTGRATALIAQEKRKLARVCPDVPVYDLVAGNDEGQVPLRKLQNHFVKLPGNLDKARIADTNRRLKALGTMNLPIPKGPMPKNARMPKGMRG